MNYVGIKNWKEKNLLVKKGSFLTANVKTKNLVFDCERHLEFLKWIKENPNSSQFSDTLYYDFYCLLTSQEMAERRCQQFKEFYQSVLEEGFRTDVSSAVVTKNGARLDGSHRSSIAHVMGIEQLKVQVFNWLELFSEKRVRHITHEIKRKQKHHLGKKGTRVFQEGKSIGDVMFSDFFPLIPKFRIPFTAPRYKAQEYYAVKLLVPDEKGRTSRYESASAFDS